MLLITFFILVGLIYGSFLNMLLWRLPRGEGPGGRSHCTTCAHQLAWHDLLPVVSYLLSKGRCRYCKASIPKRYLWVELGSGLSFALFYIFALPYQNITSASLQLIFLAIFFGLLCFDLMYFILPDVMVILGIVLALGYALTLPAFGTSFLISGLVSAGFFAILYVASRGKWLGFGDVKLVLFIGLVFGFPLVYIVIVGSIWAGAIVGLLLVATHRATMKNALPFGAFLCAFSIGVLIFRHNITFLETFFH